jgi:hypothetical protein
VNIPALDEIHATFNAIAFSVAKLDEQITPILCGHEIIEANLTDDIFPGNKEWLSRNLEDRVVMLVEEYRILKDRVAELESEYGPMWPNHATVKIRWIGPPDSYRSPAGWAKRDDQGNLVSAYSGLPLSPDCWEVIEEKAA